MYEFILVTLYTKISEKKDLHPVGISTRDQYGLHRCSARYTTTPPPPLVPILFIYHTIRLPSKKVDYTISLVWHIQSLCEFTNKHKTNTFNSLTAIDGHDRQYFNELRSTVVSRRIFIRSQSLIAR